MSDNKDGFEVKARIVILEDAVSLAVLLLHFRGCPRDHTPDFEEEERTGKAVTCAICDDMKNLYNVYKEIKDKSKSG